jgi:hypothetical protein
MMKEPIFRSIFGEAWSSLPKVMHKHYANTPFSEDVMVAKGTMDVSLSPIAKLLSPLFRLFGTLVPYDGRDVPVTVFFRSDLHSAAFRIDRQFLFPGKKPYHFHSSMVQVNDNDIIEFMRFGLGWRMHYLWDGKKVVLHHQGYVLKLFGKLISLPIDFLVGHVYAEEHALSDNVFRMRMQLAHPLLGTLFEYKGVFTING